MKRSVCTDSWRPIRCPAQGEQRTGGRGAWCRCRTDAAPPAGPARCVWIYSSSPMWPAVGSRCPSERALNLPQRECVCVIISTRIISAINVCYEKHHCLQLEITSKMPLHWILRELNFMITVQKVSTFFFFYEVLWCFQLSV